MMMTCTPGYHRRWFTTRLWDCMPARGWPVKDEDQWPHVGPSAVANTNLKPRIRYSARCQARLDAKTHAKHEAWAPTVHPRRSAILRFIMRCGLTQTRGWTVDMAIPGTTRPLSLLLEPELLQQMLEVSAAHVTSTAQSCTSTRSPRPSRHALWSGWTRFNLRQKPQGER